MRPHPTTAEYLATNAARWPSAPAWWEGGEVLDYATFHAMVSQCGHVLREMGVRKGQRVAISGPGMGIEVVLLLAAESLGAVTVSFGVEGDVDAPWIFGHVDWVFSTRPQQVPEPARFVQVDNAFARGLREPGRRAAPRWDPLESHEPQRILRTSGSSGRSKFMVVSRQAHEWWIRSAMETVGGAMDARTRYLALAPMVVHAAYARVSLALRCGGLVLSGEGRDIGLMAPTHITGLPLQFERLLQQLPAGYEAPAAVWLTSFGGPATPTLRSRLQAVFHSALRNGYGSNETAIVCEDLDASGTGAIRAGVDVQVLDAQGQPVPLGVAGRLVVRSPALASGYVDRPEESAAAFRDGWFHSSDVGTLLAPRVLRLAGRQDDLVNVGGLKVPATQFEAALHAQPGIADTAVVAVQLEGDATLGVAVVLHEDVTQDAGMLQVRQALKLPEGSTARVLVLKAIPRLLGGKADRMALLQAFHGR